MKKYSLIILSLVWISCESGGNGYRNLFNNHYGFAFPVKEITFKSDKNTSVTLQATITDRLGSTPLNLQDATYFNEDYIFADGFSNRLLITDNNFEEVRFTGRKGKGPHEFAGNLELFSNDSLLFVYDDKLRRVQTYNDQLELTETYALSFQSYPLNAEAGNNYAAIPVINDSSGTIYFFQGPLKGTYFHKTLNPPGNQPRALNATVFSIRDDGMILVAYKALPYIFRYEIEGEPVLKEIYHFGGIDTENFLNRPIRGGSNGQPGMLVRTFFDGITILKNNVILVHRGLLFVFNLNTEKVSGLYKLRADSNHFNIHSLRTVGDKVFVYDVYQQKSGLLEFNEEGMPVSFYTLN